LEADKAEKIPFGVVESRHYIEKKIFSLLMGFLVFLYSDRAVKLLNPQMKQFGMEHIQSIQMKSEGT
jgi:hypothetical protein